ncbi:MAG: hypothetical protein IKQ23_03735, partial [Treponema sp.]|nr:hypothetical protein [Treponema sp.]
FKKKYKKKSVKKITKMQKVCYNICRYTKRENFLILVLCVRFLARTMSLSGLCKTGVEANIKKEE